MKRLLSGLLFLFIISSSACNSSNNNPLNAPIFNPYDEETWNFALVSSIDGYSIYLYAKDIFQEGGMLLYYKGEHVYLDNWSSAFPRLILPQLFYYDLNKDGINELIAIIAIGSGTGVSIYDLHVLNIDNANDDGYEFTQFSLIGTEINQWMDIPMYIEVSENSEAHDFILGSKRFTIDNFDSRDIGYQNDVFFGDIVTFEFEDKQLKVIVGVSILCEISNTPIFFGVVEAFVLFDGKNLFLGEYTFTL
ncbi:MAG: hypothetical protein FWC91_12695 [Defluviitaleaceae bacterium]|nr:hypothetical protein [Defluviitaleaceae bacterium]